MFCTSCGAKISDNAKFCAKCGAKQELTEEQASFSDKKVDTGKAETKLVPAKCTNCGGQLDVDASQQAAVCPYCNTAFIVEQAINNFNVKNIENMNIANATINVQGVDVKNLVARAKSFEDNMEYETALDYYNRVLDADVKNLDALEGMHRVKDKIKNYVYITGNTTSVMGFSQTVEGVKDYIRIKNKSGEIIEQYLIKNMKDVKWLDLLLVSSITFSYPGKLGFVSLRFNHHRGQCKDMLKFIQDAQKGIYPDYKK